MNLHDIVTLIAQTLIVLALLWATWKLEQQRRTIAHLRDTVRRLTGGADLENISPALVDQLRQLSNQYGPFRVALAAARLTDQQLLISYLTADENEQAEQGRRLASQRDDLIARGINPNDLETPL